MMQDELKACPVPWCGGDVLEILRSAFGHNYFVKCQHCGATGPAMIDKAEAITAWNTPADPALAAAQAKVERLRDVLERFVASARVGSGNAPVTRSARVNCPAGIYHDARAALVQP
jgi:hypothetical protein